MLDIEEDRLKGIDIWFLPNIFHNYKYDYFYKVGEDETK